LAAIVTRPARVKVIAMASPIVVSARNSSTSERRSDASTACSRSPRPSAKTTSRYIDAIVGYWSGPPARTWSPTDVTAGRNIRSPRSTASTWKYSSAASVATTTPEATHRPTARWRRRRLVIPATANTYTAAAAATRPVMCQALARSTGAAADARARAAINAAQADASGGQRRGNCPDNASAAPQHAIARKRAASTLLTDCHGRRTSGAVVSNGARTASANTPAAATTLDIVLERTNSKILATRSAVPWKARRLHSPLPHAVREPFESGTTRKRRGHPYGRRKAVS